MSHWASATESGSEVSSAYREKKPGGVIFFSLPPRAPVKIVESCALAAILERPAFKARQVFVTRRLFLSTGLRCINKVSIKCIASCIALCVTYISESLAGGYAGIR